MRTSFSRRDADDSEDLGEEGLGELGEHPGLFQRRIVAALLDDRESSTCQVHLEPLGPRSGCRPVLSPPDEERGRTNCRETRFNGPEVELMGLLPEAAA